MTKKAFFTILLLAFILRFYKLGSIPLSLDWDEVSNAYNAYSILKTGKDEYGSFLPLTNRSFDDYKPPLYMYLNIPSVAIFNLNEFSARLPSAIFGFLTVPFVYFLTKILFKKESIALLSMFFITISPWHLQFSRVGFEANVGLFFTVSAATLFLYGLKNHKLFALSALLFGLSFYSYHSQRVFIPLILLSLTFVFKKDLFTAGKKQMVSFLLILGLIVVPLLLLSPQKALFGRLQSASSEEVRKDSELSISLVTEDGKSFISRVVHNRRVIAARRYIGNYLSYFDMNYLFIRGDDNFRHHIEGTGMFYLYQLPLLLAGIYSLIRKNDKSSRFLLLWFLLAPVAAIPATPNPHAVRSLPMVVAATLISAYGALWIFERKLNFKKTLLFIASVVIFVSFIVYLHNYFFHYPFDKASFWQYGYKEAVLESKNSGDRFGKIIVDGTLEQAYIFWLFYNNYDPNSYQQNGSRENFGKYFFQSKKTQSSNELFISANDVFPAEFTVLKTIYDYQGKAIIKIGHPK